MYAVLKSKIKQDNGLKSILRNISWLFLDKVIRIGLGFILTAWTARHLGTEIFGIWNYAIAFVALFSVFSTLGLDNIVVREIVKNESSKNEILGAAFLLKFSGGVLALVLSLLTIAVVRPGNNSLLLIVGIIALSFIFQSFDVIDYFYQSKLRSKLVVLARNAAFIFGAIVKVVLLLSKAPLIYFVSTSLFEIAITSVFLIWMYNRCTAVDCEMDIS
jgi:PST family polysaccharide transporter